MSYPFILCLVIFLGLAALRVPVAFAMYAGAIFYLLASGQDLGLVAGQSLNGLFDGFVLLSVPLFIIAASFMSAGTVTDRLLGFCVAIVGRFRGGLGHVNVVANIIFAGMSGSAIADAAGIGKVIIDMMRKNNRYPDGYAAAITAAASVIGPIIPPSIPMVLYALVSDTSIGYLFLGGVMPGLLLGLMLMLYNYYAATKRNFPRDEIVPLSEIPSRTWYAIPPLMLPVILLGGIYGGATTPTEAAAVAAFYALALAVFAYRAMDWKTYQALVLDAGRGTAVVGVIIASALLFNYIVASENIPRLVAHEPQGSRGRAAHLPVVGERAVPPPRLPVRRHDAAPDRHPVVPAGGARARRRSRAFRRRHGGQHHDRPDHPALWGPAVRHQRHLQDSAARHHPGDLAVHRRRGGGAGHDDRLPQHRPVAAAPAGLQGVMVIPGRAKREPGIQRQTPSSGLDSGFGLRPPRNDVDDQMKPLF